MKLSPVQWTNVKVADGFWTPRMETNRTATLPLEYALNRKNGVMDAYQWDWWNPADGKPPWKIWLGDVGKWIEAAAYSLALRPDPRLSRQVEDAIQRMLKGQKPDGYLYPNRLSREWRFANLAELHELYEVGHDMEGAVAYWQATGRREFLDAMCRCADFIDARLGPGPGKKRGYDGHPEIELALVKLYRATGERRYLKLAKFFIDERGQRPNYFDRETKAAKKNGVFTMGWV